MTLPCDTICYAILQPEGLTRGQIDEAAQFGILSL
jgi:hypothetical protein